MCVSTIGTWMQNTAQPWLAYSLTKSALLLSVVSALQFLPALLFSLFAGVLIDRLPKKRMLIITQSLSLAITFALWLLVHSGNVQYWHLLISASLLGLVNTLDMPLRQSFVVEMVGHDDLMNAIALNSLTFNVARMIGPSLAGILMGTIGISACFLVNSLSFAAVLISLFFIHPVACAVPEEKEKKGMFESIGEGLKYIFHDETLYTTLLIMAVISTFALNYGVAIPVFAQQILGLSETGYGFLLSALGAGALVGAPHGLPAGRQRLLTDGAGDSVESVGGLRTHALARRSRRCGSRSSRQLGSLLVRPLPHASRQRGHHAAGDRRCYLRARTHRD